MLGGAFAPTGSYPASCRRSSFPYAGGPRFVAALRERAGRRWTLVDLAERAAAGVDGAGPHPDKWVRLRPPLPRCGSMLGSRWGGLAPAA